MQYHNLCGLKQEKRVLSQNSGGQKPNIQVSVPWSFWRLQVRSCLRPLSYPLVASHTPQLVDGRLLPVPLLIIFPLCVCLYVQIFPFYKDTSHIGLGATLMASLQLNCLQRPSFQNWSHSQELRAGLHIFWGNTIQPTTLGFHSWFARSFHRPGACYLVMADSKPQI